MNEPVECDKGLSYILKIRFGYIIRYPKDRVSDTGYQYEPWHLR